MRRLWKSYRHFDRKARYYAACAEVFAEPRYALAANVSAGYARRADRYRRLARGFAAALLARRG